MDTNMDVAVSSVHPRGKQHAMHLPGKLRVLIERNTMVGSNLLHRLDLVLSITSVPQGLRRTTTIAE